MASVVSPGVRAFLATPSSAAKRPRGASKAEAAARLVDSRKSRRDPPGPGFAVTDRPSPQSL